VEASSRVSGTKASRRRKRRVKNKQKCRYEQKALSTVIERLSQSQMTLPHRRQAPELAIESIQKFSRSVSKNKCRCDETDQDISGGG
jgi:hypothetical protein